jgi:hypothetical protein
MAYFIKYIKINKGKIVSRITVPDIIECVEYSDDGSLIAVGCTSSFVKFIYSDYDI